MRTIVSIALLVAVQGVVRGQTGFSWSGGAVLDLTVSVESKTEPPEPDILTGSEGVYFLGKGGPQGIRRFITNTKTHEYAGYDMKLEAIKPGQYRATFGALSLTAKDLNLSDPTAWRISPAPIFPPPQTVTTADTIVLDVMENPTTGQKIVDYIRLQHRNCDSAGGGPAQLACLTSIVEDARRELQDKLNQLERIRTGAAAQSIILSQQSWTRYKDDACSTLETAVKRVNCEITLTRSRIHDLGSH
jgi:uncharacterized protein YecT (DUF1311 family)